MGGMQIQSDDALSVARLTYENGGTNSTVIIPKEGGKLSVGAHMANAAPYHLLEGNLSVSNLVSTNGFSTTLYTGNGTSQSITTGVDMDSQHGNDPSERYGGLVWIKGRSVVSDNNLVDSVRGVSNTIFTNLTSGQVNAASNINVLLNNGFTTGSSSGTNASGATYTSWNFQTTHRKSGTTNHGQAYTEHYNPFTGFTIIQYTGSGKDLHEIPHSLGRRLDFYTVKALTSTTGWRTFGLGKKLFINTTDASIGDVVLNSSFDSTDKCYLASSDVTDNASGVTFILYGWANSYIDKSNKLIGNYEIGTYNGTGLAGNKVNTRGKPAWVMVKRLDVVGDWYIFDNKRATYPLFPNQASLEPVSGYSGITYNYDNFTINDVDTYNLQGGKYLYLVVYDNDSGSGKSKYPRAQDTSTLNINNAKIPFANGINDNGVKFTNLLRNEVISGLTLTPGKNYVYMKNDGTYGVTPYAPNIDSYSGFGDYFDSKRNKWFSSRGNLISNGNFTNNTTGWTPTGTSGTTLTVVNGRCKLSGTMDHGLLTTVTGLTVGKEYVFTFKYEIPNSINKQLFFDQVTGTTLIPELGNKWVSTSIASTPYSLPNTGTYSYRFTASVSSGTINVRNTDNETGDWYISNIAILEVTPPVTEITESRNYLNHIVYADHNGQVTYVEELPKTHYAKELTVSDKLNLQNVKSIESNGDEVHKINGVEKFRIKEDGSILNQDGMALSSGGYKNYIINGKFEVWQRGESFTLTPGLTLITADRFRVYNGTNQNLIVEKSIVNSIASKAYSRMRLSFLTAPTTGSVTISQRIEDVTRISGGNFVSSCFIATNENMVINQSITHNFGTGGSASTTYSGTPNASVIGGYIMSKYTLPYVNSQTIGVSNYAELTYDLPFRSLNGFSFTNVQLEEGSVATPFEQRSIGLELALCQRYYQTGRVGQYNYSSVSGVSNSLTINFPVKMRTTPSITQTVGYSMNIGTTMSISDASDIGYTATRGTITAVGIFQYINNYTANADY